MGTLGAPGELAKIAAKNVSALLKSYPADDPLLKKPPKGISKRGFGYAREGKHAMTLRTLDAIARHFGVDGWKFLVKDIPVELMRDPLFAETVDTYTRTDVNGQKAIRAVINAVAKLDNNPPH